MNMHTARSVACPPVMVNFVLIVRLPVFLERNENEILFVFINNKILPGNLIGSGETATDSM